tara:strand:+ start:116 stop:760 length:645 start_codon:yes stop_codon:yes gene_type:complete
MTSLESPVTINIENKNKPSNPSDNQDNYSEFKDYIIRNNIILQNDIQLKQTKITELQSTVLEQEQEQDKYDTRIRYMKGLLQNLNELRNLYDKIKAKSDTKIEIIKNHNKTTKKINHHINGLLIAANIINIITLFRPSSLRYVNFTTLLFQISYLITSAFIIYKIKNNYNNIKIISKQSTDKMREQNQEISMIKLEIKNLEESSISLDNWISDI